MDLEYFLRTCGRFTPGLRLRPALRSSVSSFLWALEIYVPSSFCWVHVGVTLLDLRIALVRSSQLRQKLSTGSLPDMSYELGFFHRDYPDLLGDSHEFSPLSAASPRSSQRRTSWYRALPDPPGLEQFDFLPCYRWTMETASSSSTPTPVSCCHLDHATVF